MASIDPASEMDQCNLILNDLVRKTACLSNVDRERILPNIERLRDSLDHLGQAFHERERLRQENDERFQILADSCPLLIWMSDAQGSNLYINQTYRELIGISLEEARTYNWKSIFHPDDAPEYLDAFRQAVRERKEFSGEARVRRADAAWLWIKSYAAPCFSSDGAYLGHVGNSMDINPLKLFEQALRESEQKYRNLFETMLQGVVYRDVDGTITWINPAAEDILGKAKAELIGQSSVSHEKNTFREDGSPFPAVEYPSMVALRTGCTVRDVPMQVYNPRKQEYRWIMISAVPVFRDEDEKPYQVFTVFDDITERRNAEKKLRESEDRFRTLIDEAPISIALARDSKFLYANPAYLAVHGISSTEELIGRPIYESVAPESLLTSKERAARRRQGLPVAKNYEYVALRKDGSHSFMMSSVAQINLADGPATVGFFQDITERKQAEEEILHSKAKMDAALASTPDAVFVSDADGNFINFNDAFGTFHRFKNKNECSKTLTDYPDILDMFFLDGTPAPLEMWAVSRALRGETARNAEYRLRRKDTGESWIGSYSFSPIRDAQGAIVGSIVAARDITEIKQAEEYLRESRERERAWAAELEALMDAVPALIWISRDPECHEITGNRYGHEFFRMGSGRNVSMTNSSEDLPAHKAMKDGQPVPPSDLPLQFAARTGKPARDYTIDFVFEDSEVYNLLGNVNPLLDVDGKPSGAIGAFLDITRLRQLELEEQEQANQVEIQRRLLEYREQERQVLARDLHDGPVQNMSSLLFNVQYLKEMVSDPASLAELDQIAQGLKSSIQTLRSMIHELRPPAVLRFGLAKALKFQFDDFRETHPEIDLDMSQIADDSGLSEQARLVLYRIAKEAVNNIAKHAGATKIEIRFDYINNQVLLEIRDNGKGFVLSNDLIDYSTHGHYGLIGMKERAEVIGGEFRIATGPDIGTTIIVTIPVGREK